MILAGLQKTTLVDFPGIVAATVFTRGCSFRCGFCHNPELVIPEQYRGDLISEREFINFLVSRVGKLEGVCITGGEPLLQPDIEQFISHIKALGFKVKLDTNGSFPDQLQKIIQEGDLDYIAMDIKAPLKKYSSVANPKSGIRNPKQIQNPKQKTDCHSERSEESQQFNNLAIQQLENLEDKILKSINLIMSSDIDYEFRTTVCHPYHTVDDFKKIGKMIKGAKRYYIQNFVKSKHVDPKQNYRSFSSTELKDVAKTVEKFVKKVDIR